MGRKGLSYERWWERKEEMRERKMKMDENKVRNLNIKLGKKNNEEKGVLSMVMEIEGEVVERVDKNIGMMNRGKEKMMEEKKYIKDVNYIERIEYVEKMNKENEYEIEVESIMDIEVKKRGKIIRVIY